MYGSIGRGIWQCPKRAFPSISGRGGQPYAGLQADVIPYNLHLFHRPKILPVCA